MPASLSVVSIAVLTEIRTSHPPFADLTVDSEMPARRRARAAGAEQRARPRSSSAHLRFWPRVIAKTPLPFSPVRISRRIKLERHGTLRGTRCRGLDAAEIMPPHRGSAKALTLRLPEPAGAVAEERGPISASGLRR